MKNPWRQVCDAAHAGTGTTLTAEQVREMAGEEIVALLSDEGGYDDQPEEGDPHGGD